MPNLSISVTTLSGPVHDLSLPICSAYCDRVKSTSLPVRARTLDTSDTLKELQKLRRASAPKRTPRTPQPHSLPFYARNRDRPVLVVRLRSPPPGGAYLPRTTMLGLTSPPPSIPNCHQTTAGHRPQRRYLRPHPTSPLKLQIVNPWT